jgi:hypothetical protein
MLDPVLSTGISTLFAERQCDDSDNSEQLLSGFGQEKRWGTRRLVVCYPHEYYH